ncbi:MAG: Hsp20/alpha crystallin family protein [Bacteroidales bacterium]|nr:Hsp20/alpha crystallin family protein [Bacteroidales bacterium]
MAILRFYNPYFSAYRDENTDTAYRNLQNKYNFNNHCGCEQGSRPAANIVETDKEYRIEMALPGVNKQSVSIRHEKELLTISVEQPQHQENKENFTLREFDYSGAMRTFNTGNKVNTDQIGARLENGILTVVLPKKEAYVVKPAQAITID